MDDRPTARRDVGDSATAPRDDWDRHWDEYASSAADNPAQEFRRRLVISLLGDVGTASRVLDIGSGTGDLAAVLRVAHPGAALLGLELSRSGVELSRRKVPGAVFLRRDLSIGDPPPAEYHRWATHAVCSEVLEHVDDPRRVLVNCRPYLGQGCRLVVTVPGGPMTSYDRHIGHRKHYSPDELAALLRDAGFDVLRATGAGFPIFNLYRLLMRVLGHRLIGVAAAATPSVPARVAMRILAVLLRHDVSLSKRGWQIVATARLPREATAADDHSADDHSADD